VGQAPTRPRHVEPRSQRKELPYLVTVAGADIAPFRLENRSTVVGRGPVDLQIDNDGLSREHAKLVRNTDGLYTIVDLNSTNGTWVQGQRVEIATLQEGDEIQLGPDIVLRFTRARAPVPTAGGGPDVEAKLTARELEVARLVSRGLTNAQIAQQLGISTRTVTSHLDHIYNRLGVRTRVALAHWVTLLDG
jgi:DNA-binding CsgD family transcriptional regulator